MSSKTGILPRVDRLTRAYRHIGRYRQILTVLVRYGFGRILERLQIEEYAETGVRLSAASRAEFAGEHEARRVRRAFEELGPTFMKMGQLLSTRLDLVSAEMARELEKLQDRAAPFSGEEARLIIEHDLGRSVDDIFREFDTEPFAAASLGQAHRAVLADNGREVVVKVQRPGIRPTIETDLEILEHLAHVAERRIEVLQVQQPAHVLAEFREALRKELDYTVEAAHLKRFSALFQDDPGVRIPEVYPQWTTQRVLTMERLPGRKVSAVSAAGDDGFDGQLVARRGVDAILQQIFVHGFFHADPHPGNVLILPDNVVGFIDLGQVGRLDRDTRFAVADLLGALVGKDVEAATESLLELTEGDVPPDRGALEAEMAEFMDWWVDRRLGDVQIGKMVWRLLEIAGRHRRRVSPDLYLVLKALGTLEVFARRLDPGFDLAERARPVLRKVVQERLSPRRLAEEAWRSSLELTRLFKEIPRELRQILEQARRGRLHVQIEHQRLAPLLHTLEVVVNRLVFSIVLAALLIASSLVALGNIPPKWHGIPVIGVFGYALSGITALGLLWLILRRGRI